MKSKKFSAKISKEIKSKSEEIHNLEGGITKELIEKYKPKVIYKIETFNEKDVQRRLA